MKKIKVALLGLSLIISLTACGSDAENMYKEEMPTILDDELEVALEASIENADVQETLTDATQEVETFVAESVHVEAKQEIIDASWYSGMVQFNDIVVQLPIHLNELVKLGFDYEVYGKSIDYLFSENESNTVYFFLNDEKLFCIDVQSDKEGFHTLEEINPLITEISISGNDISENAKDLVDIYFSGGIKLGDSYKVIEEKLGVPYEIDSSMTYKYGSIIEYGLGMDLYNDKNTQTIVSICIGKKEEIENLNNLSEITIENVQSMQDDTYHNITLKYLPNYKVESADRLQIIFEYENDIYTMYITLNPGLASSYIYTDEERCFEENAGDGTYRMLDEYYDNFYSYCVIIGDNTVEGIIGITNISSKKEENITEKFLDKMVEIVKSIQFQYY